MDKPPPTAKDRRDALPYLATAWAARLLTFAALGAGLWAWVRFGPLAGLVALGAALWAARGVQAPMPDELRKRFD